MASKASYSTPKTTTDLPDSTTTPAAAPAVTEKGLESIVQKYIAEYTRWRSALLPYWQDRFDRNYRQYTAYTETKGTETKISDPTAPELIEKAVTRYFERDPKFFLLSRGHKIPKFLERVIIGTAEYIWTNPETVQSTGTMRSKLKKVGREFSVIGNVGTETFYNLESDSPDFRHTAIEDVVFDPTRTLKTSKVYYLRRMVTIEFLKDNAEIQRDGKVVSGIFKNIDQIEKMFEGAKEKSQTPIIERRGQTLAETKEGPIELISRYEGAKVCRFIKNAEKDNQGGLILQEFENKVLKEDPLDFAMDIEVGKVPYAFSFLDFINGLTAAKDMTLNQIIDYSAKLLNPPLFADPSLGPISKLTLANAWRLGGLVFAAPNQADHKPMPPLPSSAFDMLNYLQQRSEQVTSIGSYLGGVPNQASDKTKGTLGGIQTMLQQAIGPVRDRQQNIEESIVEPIINKMLKMAGALMGKDEIKWVLITGQSPEYVKVTRGILLGEITVRDLELAELVDPLDAQQIRAILQAKGADPETYPIFKSDFLIRVEAGSMAEADTEAEIDNFKSWVEFNYQMGIPMDMLKVSEELASRTKIKEPERFLQQQPLATAPGTMPANPAVPAVQPPMPPGPAAGQPPMGPAPVAPPPPPQPQPQPVAPGPAGASPFGR
jgi:hypothetical protein